MLACGGALCGSEAVLHFLAEKVGLSNWAPNNQRSWTQAALGSSHVAAMSDLRGSTGGLYQWGAQGDCTSGGHKGTVSVGGTRG
eukprot:1139197-Pelagomonas_calceolata.AAC.1